MTSIKDSIQQFEDMPFHRFPEAEIDARIPKRA